MMSPMACQFRPVIAQQVYLETQRLLWVHLVPVPFVTYAYDLLFCICQKCLLDTRIFFLFCVITI